MHRYLPVTGALMFLAAVSFVSAQSTPLTVADGVYNDVQATRGAAAYDQACGRCHRQDLGGGDGPALKDDRFNRNFAGKDLKTLYTRVATTMPRGAPASMSEGAYLDILAHMLRENGFPAGSRELTSESLEGVEMLATRPKPLPPVGDFSYVEVVGCLSPGADGSWMLTNAIEPDAAAAPGTPQFVSPDTSAARALGTNTYRLLDAFAYAPESKRGQKVYVRGLLIRLPSEQRMTISDLRTLSQTCQ